MGTRCPVIFLQGAGGGATDLSVLRLAPDDELEFQTVGYPGWRRYIAEDFSAPALLTELTDEVVRRVPAGPLVLLGMSLGGHFCYAIALELLARGREVAGVCLIDSFMVHSAGPGKGWMGRAVKDALDPLRRGQEGGFLRHLLSKLYRALLRLAGARLAGVLRRRPGAVTDPLLEHEISMRLLLRETAPWIASLDRDPRPLAVPVALLRTALTAGDDAAWQRRCPAIRILEVRGGHHTLFEPEHVGGLRDAFNTARRDWRCNDVVFPAKVSTREI
jgi:thioesterase domain-containing protein